MVGVRGGDTISMFYDPMIAKLCTHAATRDQAITLMERALDEYAVLAGVVSNLCFLRCIYRNSNFRKGQYSTKFIAQEYPQGFSGTELDISEVYEIISGAFLFHISRILQQQQSQIPLNKTRRDVTLAPNKHTYYINMCNHNHPDGAHVHNNNQFYKVSTTSDAAVVGGSTVQFPLSLSIELDHTSSSPSPSSVYSIEINKFDWPLEGALAYVQYKHSQTPLSPSVDNDEVIQYVGRDSQIHNLIHAHNHGGAGEIYYFNYHGNSSRFEVRSELEHSLSRHMLPPEHKDTSNLVLCPMPGNLVSVSVKKGDHVELGQAICTIEAMKMQV